MARITRRNFLKALPLLPILKVGWPFIEANLPSAQSGGEPNILFLVFDTLSAKHMSLFGYERETTPNLARFAERATVFHNHYAAANFTSPGTASILTGTYPWSHRAFHLHDTVNHEYVDHNIFSQLPSHYSKVGYTHNLLVFSLLHQFRDKFDILKQPRDLCLYDLEMADRFFFNDYSDAFWSEWLFLRGGADPPSSLFLSLLDRSRRFSSKRNVTQLHGELFPRGIPNLHSLAFLLEDAIDWIGEQVTSLPQPFFSYFHLLPPHEPYTTRRDFVDIFADGWKPIAKEPHFSSEGHTQQFLNRQRREYDEYLAYADAEFGRLYDSLERSGVLENTYFVFTSDHGELFERGIRGHVTLTLYDPIVHVPLLIAKPGQKERVDVFEQTSCVDLLPTFLQVTGQPIPTWCEGTLLPTFAEQTVDTNRSIFSVEAKSNPKQTALNKFTVAMSKGSHKLIRYGGYKKHEDEYELYDLADDPDELNNLYTTEDKFVSQMQEELDTKFTEVNAPYRRSA